MSIVAYNPGNSSNTKLEQGIEMANAAGAQLIIPVHHQTFPLSFEPFREPIERFENALRAQPEGPYKRCAALARRRNLEYSRFLLADQNLGRIQSDSS